MGKPRVKLKENSSLDEVERFIAEIVNSGQVEIELEMLIKIGRALGVEYLTGKEGGKGSQERFRYKGFIGIPGYQDGIFGIHRLHGGNSNPKVSMQDFKRYFLVHIRKIIELKKEER